ncbi:hypothetical protein N7535_007057 [Penicillium sp. DV-2018c]|nr:hypothetical protein N7461_006849 [Penicillium sp. DV-2018c]KAJ5567751.1 hypothetical protein N7535_007057 [Penicillium sp. DV-2018c]
MRDISHHPVNEAVQFVSHEQAGLLEQVDWEKVTNTGFLFRSWHVTSRAMFAGSCVADVFLIVLLETLHRLGREFDAFLIRRTRLRANYMTKPSYTCSGSPPSPPLLHVIGPGEDRPAATHEAPGHTYDGNAWTSHHESIDVNAPRNQTKDVNATSAAHTGHEDGCEGDKRAPYTPNVPPISTCGASDTLAPSYVTVRHGLHHHAPGNVL